MIRNLLGIGLAAALIGAPVVATAQQFAAGEGIETYSDTLPKHGATAKNLVALKTPSKKGHKSGKAHKSSHHHHAGKKKRKSAG